MKKTYYIVMIILMLQAVCIPASAKVENQYPKAILTLNDSTIVAGYLRSNLHDVGSKVAISENGDSKKLSYKIADIHSLEVIYPDGQSETYIPIHTWDKYSKKTNKNPFLATVCFSGNHIVGYRMPSQYIKSSAAVPSSNFQSYSWKYNAWIFYYQVNNSGIIKEFWVHIPVKKAPKLKSIIKNAKKNFKEYPIVAETIEARGLTAEEIIKNPSILLEILDTSMEF